LFLIDENIAILQCSYEFVDLLKKIFAGCPRCFKYYLLYDRNAVPAENGVTNKFDHMNFEANLKKDEEDCDIEVIKETIAQRKNIVFGQLLNFVNYFASLGGFDALIDGLRCGNES